MGRCLRASSHFLRNPLCTDSPKEVHQNVDSAITLYGVLGVIDLTTSEWSYHQSSQISHIAAPFLIAISDREYAGSINDSEIYRATDFKMFPIDRSSTLTQILKHPIDGALLGLLKAHFKDGNFYFSHNFDVTSSLQRQQKYNEGAMHERVGDLRCVCFSYAQYTGRRSILLE